MAKITWPGGTLLAPVPAVIITSGTMEKPNAATVAWTGIVNSEPPMTYISLRKSRHSHKIISQTGEFVINLTTASLAKATDGIGETCIFTAVITNIHTLEHTNSQNGTIDTANQIAA